MPRAITAEARLRTRNQLTIPGPIARAAGIEPGERFVVQLEPDDHDTVLLRRVRKSYAGSLPGLWGQDTQAYLEGERKTWR